MLPVITISREAGSGGHAVGQMVAEQLGIPFYDREIINKVAVETGFNIEDVENKGEYGSLLDKYLNSHFYNGLNLGDDQDKIFYAQRKVILDLAQKGPCVIVGRCADAILEEKGISSLNVFIHSDLEYRKQHSNLQEKQLLKMDKGRQFYYRLYTDREWGDYHNYHLNLDSGFIGIEGCASIIVETAQNK